MNNLPAGQNEYPIVIYSAPQQRPGVRIIDIAISLGWIILVTAVAMLLVQVSALIWLGWMALR